MKDRIIDEIAKLLLQPPLLREEDTGRAAFRRQQLEEKLADSPRASKLQDEALAGRLRTHEDRELSKGNRRLCDLRERKDR